jgi:hypothetical protein
MAVGQPDRRGTDEDDALLQSVPKPDELTCLTPGAPLRSSLSSLARLETRRTRGQHEEGKESPTAAAKNLQHPDRRTGSAGGGVRCPSSGPRPRGG